MPDQPWVDEPGRNGAVESRPSCPATTRQTTATALMTTNCTSSIPKATKEETAMPRKVAQAVIASESTAPTAHLAGPVEMPPACRSVLKSCPNTNGGMKTVIR